MMSASEFLFFMLLLVILCDVIWIGFLLSRIKDEITSHNATRFVMLNKLINHKDTKEKKCCKVKGSCCDER